MRILLDTMLCCGGLPAVTEFRGGSRRDRRPRQWCVDQCLFGLAIAYQASAGTTCERRFEKQVTVRPIGADELMTCFAPCGSPSKRGTEGVTHATPALSYEQWETAQSSYNVGMVIGNQLRVDVTHHGLISLRKQYG